MTPLSSIAMSAYTDLGRLLKDEARSGIEGKPTLKRRGGKAYWYVAQRVGTDMRFVYIGDILHPADHTVQKGIVAGIWRKRFCQRRGS